MSRRVVAKLLEGKPTVAGRIWPELSETMTRKEFLARCSLERGDILLLKFQKLPAGVKESCLVEFQDNSAIRHDTFIDSKTEMATVSLQIIK